MIIDPKKHFLAKNEEALYDLDVEKFVLSQLILQPKASFGQLVQLKIKPTHFFDKSNKNVFEAIKQLFDAGKSIDLLTVKNQLKTNKKLDEIGGMGYLAEVTNSSAGSSELRSHALILLELSAKRFLNALSSKIKKQALDPSIDAFDALDSVVEQISAWEEGLTTNNYTSISDEIRKEVTEQEERQEKGIGLFGVSTGMPSVDNVLNGWQKDTLSVIAARPAIGKTGLMLSWMLAAAKSGKTSIFFSLEMGKAQIRKRIIAQHTDVTAQALKKGHLNDSEWVRLYNQTSDLEQFPIYIDSTPHISLNELRAKCRHLKFLSALDIVFIDYLQLMEVNEFGRKFANREQEISYVSRNLKALAIELGVPIVVASQLSRSIESRGEYTFKLSDLRESGAIEQDADNVMFLHRPAAYGITEDHLGNDVSQLAEIHLLKHREGELGKFNLHFTGSKMLFKEMDD